MKKLAFLAMVAVIGCDGTSGTSETATLDAEEFAKAYSESPGKYKGKELRIKGRCYRTSRYPTDEKTGKPVIAEEREREEIFLVTGQGFSDADIMCKFAKTNRKPIQELKDNDVVTIKGKCGGIGSNGSILMENCSFVSKAAKP